MIESPYGECRISIGSNTHRILGACGAEEMPVTGAIFGDMNDNPNMLDGNSRTFGGAPVQELLGLGYDGHEATEQSRVLGFDWVVKSCFPDQPKSWQGEVSSFADTIAREIASTTLPYFPVEKHIDSEQSETISLVGIVTGSMCRTIFSGISTEQRKAHDTLALAQKNFRESQQSQHIQELVEGTGIYDLDLKVGVETEVIISNLRSNGTLRLSNEGGNAGSYFENGVVAGNFRVIDVGHKKVLKLTRKLESGPDFSIDIATFSSDPEQIAVDTRISPSQSSKKIGTHLDIWSRCVRNKVEEVGVSCDPQNIIDGELVGRIRSTIPFPHYSSAESALYALMTTARVENHVPSSQLTQEKSIGVQLSALVPNLLYLSNQQIVEGKPPSPHLCLQVAKEAIVMMSGDKDYFVKFMQESGLDIYFGVYDLVNSLNRLTQAEVDHLITNYPQFLNRWRSHMDTSISPIMGIAVPSREGILSHEEIIRKAFGYAYDPRRATATSTQNLPHVATSLREPLYVDSIFSNSPKKDLDSGESEVIARIAHIAPRGERHLERHQMFRLGGPTDRDGIRDFIRSIEMDPGLEDAHLDRFGDEVEMANMMSFYHRHHLEDPYYQWRAQGLPLGASEVRYFPNNGKYILTMRHPATLTPKRALETLKITFIR